MIQISGKNAYLDQKGEFYQKTTNKHSWKPSEVKFWSKRNMQNSAYTKPLSVKV